MSSIFPIKPSGSLTKGELVDYLKDLSKKGYSVYSDPNNIDIFIIQLTEILEIRLYLNDTEGNVRIEQFNGTRTWQLGSAKNSGSLATIITNHGKTHGINFENAPIDSRFVKSEPISNLAKIVYLGSPKLITEIHDPYIDEIALKNITILYRLGLKFSSKLRILTSSKQRKTLSEHCWELFKIEIEVQQAEIRRLPDFHRRFLLGGGKSVHLGLSLNQIDNDEIIKTERDDLDRPFFEEQWDSASILYSRKT